MNIVTLTLSDEHSKSIQLWKRIQQSTLFQQALLQQRIPATHPHTPESHKESHSRAMCKYIGPSMVPVIAAAYFCLPVI